MIQRAVIILLQIVKLLMGNIISHTKWYQTLKWRHLLLEQYLIKLKL